MTLQLALEDQLSNETFADYSKSVVYVGREGEGIIGAISVSDRLRVDAEYSVARYEFCLHGSNCQRFRCSYVAFCLHGE